MFRQVRLDERLVQLRASPLEDWESIFHLSLVNGRWPTQENEVAAGEGAATAHHWAVGSSLINLWQPVPYFRYFSRSGYQFCDSMDAI